MFEFLFNLTQFKYLNTDLYNYNKCSKFYYSIPPALLLLMDPNSSANITSFQTIHLNLDWTINFTQKCLKGFVELSVKRLNSESKFLLLDASHILTQSVSCRGSELKVLPQFMRVRPIYLY